MHCCSSALSGLRHMPDGSMRVFVTGTPHGVKQRNFSTAQHQLAWMLLLCVVVGVGCSVGHLAAG